MIAGNKLAKAFFVCSHILCAATFYFLIILMVGGIGHMIGDIVISRNDMHNTFAGFAFSAGFGCFFGFIAYALKNTDETVLTHEDVV